LVTAHFAGALQVCVLFLAVLSIDWERYARQVGPELAAGVRDAALPAAAMLAAVTVVVTYAGCILAGWLGSLAYLAALRLARRLRGGYWGLYPGKGGAGFSLPGVGGAPQLSITPQ